MTKRTLLILIVILNAIVLLGQLWPEGAPPFARIFNIVTLIINLVFTAAIFRKENLKNR